MPSKSATFGIAGALSGDIATGTPEQAAEFLKTENERWAKVIREANTRTE